MVFNLYVFEGMKHREIASLLDISEGTSKSNLSDARKILKKHLEPELKIAR
jgi:DNA-directed RNA polymerase specialized sigma24 family protein